MASFLQTTATVVVTALICILCSTSVDAKQISSWLLPTNAELVSNRCSTEPSAIPINNGMFSELFPTIPNLQLGHNYFFGKRHRTGQLEADYVLPSSIAENSVLFIEARGIWWTNNTAGVSKASNRGDISLGKGY